MKSFAVTGMGRSGTQFLARALNDYSYWTVRHEPHPGFQSVAEVNHRFDLNSHVDYGEVNSYLRFQLMSLRVHVKAVILRHPMEIFQSMFNRGKPKLDHLQESLFALDNLVSQGVRVFSFSKMTSDKDYLIECAYFLRVSISSSIVLAPSNASTKISMPLHLQKNAASKLGWFIDLYGDQF